MLLSWLKSITTIQILGLTASVLAAVATVFSYFNNYIISYGDAESHLNIAKRIVDSLTPGFSQLGGVWLPLPHLLLTPLVFFNPLWRSGLAGSIVSGICFVVASIYVYKLVLLLTKDKTASVVGFLVFVLNPNLLYLQTTPLTEPILIAFFVLSSYFFVKFIFNEEDFLALAAAALFGFCASLSRYDGWLLVILEFASLIFIYLYRYFFRGDGATLAFINRARLKSKSLEFGDTKLSLTQILEGQTILFGSLAFLGILLWLLWDYLILGDPLYFTDSPFSAKSQQQSFLARGELPAYHHLFQSILYYLVTTAESSGEVIFLVALIGLLVYLLYRSGIKKYIVTLILLTPFIFYTFTLFAGQSVIFLPSLSPSNFQWHLFNVRYGAVMIPGLSFFVGYLMAKSHWLLKPLVLMAVIFQMFLFGAGLLKVDSLEDGIYGLSAASTPDAQKWLAIHYDDGLVLLDDYARTLSIIRSGLPMDKIIYIGNKPYWEESLKDPSKYATWVVTQKDDAVWKNVYLNPSSRGILYAKFNKVYTSPEILIFKRIPENGLSSNPPNFSLSGNSTSIDIKNAKI